MRRREKFIIVSILLSLGLWLVEFVPLEWRYVAVAFFMGTSYLFSAWALWEDLQPLECLTIVTFPALYAGAVSLFYFLLPENFLSKIFILGLFGVGMYALFLTSNIFSVAKGRTIQLLHAAHAIGLWFTLLTSLLFTNTIFSLKLPFFLNTLLIGLSHAPLILMSLWSVNLEPKISQEVGELALLLTLIIAELGLVLSVVPLPVWHSALFVMATLYIGLGIMHNFLKGRLFRNTLNEYSLVALFVGVVFMLLLPLK